MARSTPSILATDLLLGYLQHADSITAGVPNATDLPKLRMDSGNTRPAPCLSLNGMESKDSNGARRVVTVVGLLPYLLRNSDASKPTDTPSQARTLTAATAAGYIEQLEARLRDRASFFAYLGALPEADREGWQIISYRTLKQPEIQRAEGQAPNEVTLAIAAELTFAWAV